MAYSPRLSYKSSRSLRRIAWALNLLMTKAAEEIFSFLPQVIDSSRICISCKDKTKCDECFFKNAKSDQSKVKPLMQKRLTKMKMALNKQYL